MVCGGGGGGEGYEVPGVGARGCGTWVGYVFVGDLRCGGLGCEVVNESLKLCWTGTGVRFEPTGDMYCITYVLTFYLIFYSKSTWPSESQESKTFFGTKEIIKIYILDVLCTVDKMNVFQK